ncbi:MAG: phage Gp37/Gp68 family protein [Treponema sp.]|jgi:protein gp37|nr:phage Gp37/Gp68 family protein [Treponema sp.]
MNKTKIEWCDSTWNPVTGCLHGCPYCYARNITHRFGFRIDADPGHGWGDRQRVGKECECNTLHILRKKTENSYPYGFDPTFHKYRLDEPQRIKKPQNIFVCSMADLFGAFIPDEWIQEVFQACEKAPQHRYLFLTKNPERYIELSKKGLLPSHSNFWFGTSVTDQETPHFWSTYLNTFISIEPLLNEFHKCDSEIKAGWVIAGAETGNRKGKIIPKREWIENIVNECRRAKVSVFLKNSLASIYGEPLIQEYPWEAKSDN